MVLVHWYRIVSLGPTPRIHAVVLEDHVLDNHHGMIYHNHHKLEIEKQYSIYHTHNSETLVIQTSKSSSALSKFPITMYITVYHHHNITNIYVAIFIFEGGRWVGLLLICSFPCQYRLKFNLLFVALDIVWVTCCFGGSKSCVIMSLLQCFKLKRPILPKPNGSLSKLYLPQVPLMAETVKNAIAEMTISSSETLNWSFKR